MRKVYKGKERIYFILYIKSECHAELKRRVFPYLHESFYYKLDKNVPTPDKSKCILTKDDHSLMMDDKLYPTLGQHTSIKGN